MWLVCCLLAYGSRSDPSEAAELNYIISGLSQSYCGKILLVFPLFITQSTQLVFGHRLQDLLVHTCCCRTGQVYTDVSIWGCSRNSDSREEWFV